MVLRELGYFFAALGFFTRLPVPAWVAHDADQLSQAPRYLPLIGVIVGLIGAVVTELTALLLPISVAVLLGIAATVWITGAFHEDGFADACDGFGGGWDKARVLAIMKDSRLGSFGAIGLVLLFFLKWQALVDVDASETLFDGATFLEPPYGAVLPFALVAAHAISRLAALVLMANLDYVREDESTKSRSLTPPLRPIGWLPAIFFGLAPCLWLPLPQVLVALLFVVLSAALAARYFQRRIGGYTGDCLGAVQQVCELAFYLGLLCEFAW
ncbi:MAG TPA: adenosylcobinamide-GDP ribazoletransferase [Rhodocyclaceae bacterium]|nr:adenosylcobinamide-GDP ribazoletransferase [Rhodocyclaceae bacterium]